MRVIFDLDGTLALNEHRAHFVQGEKKDWRAFFAACGQDEPAIPIIATLRALAIAGHHVEIWSGRSDEVRAITEAWLAAHDLGHIPLRMRAEGDFTPDHKLKKEWLLSEIAAGREPHLAFDDRNIVVAMWREHGITCIQVAEGNF